MLAYLLSFAILKFDCSQLKQTLSLILMCSVLAFSTLAASIPKSSSHPQIDSRSRSPEKVSTIPQSISPDSTDDGKVQLARGSDGRMTFEENRGQVDPHIKFVSRGNGYSLFLSATEMLMTLREGANNSHKITDSVETKPAESMSHSLSVTFVGANKNARAVGLERRHSTSNYFIGNDPTKWHANVANFSKVEFKEPYPGVSLIYYGKQNNLEYDFVVAPHADSSAIRLRFDGAEDTRLEPNGDLVLKVKGGNVHQKKPTAYQQLGGLRKEIACQYVITEEGYVKFKVSEYDRNEPLIIDPIVIYSTFLGGNLVEQAQSIALDAAGNIFITGLTASLNFPTTTGAFSRTKAGGGDCYVAKLNPNGTELIYATYFGGDSSEGGASIAVDADGNAYVTGSTLSVTFPVTAGAFKRVNVEGSSTSDAFVTKLNPDGSALLYSTYLGSADDDDAQAIAIDAFGNAYVAGNTNSRAFPVTAGAFQTTAVYPSWPGFVTKLNPSGSGLVYSTLLGGTTYESPNGIAVDSLGNAYVTGQTNSTDFPTTPGAFRTSHIADDDSFVTKLNPSGTGLVYSTYLPGGSNKGVGIDIARSIAVDSSGYAYVAGETSSTNFPTTAGAYRTTSSGGILDAFVTKVNLFGTALIYSTYIGGSGMDRAYGLGIDSAGDAYVIGNTDSGNFPTTSNALQPTNPGGISAFLTRLNSTGNSLKYSTFLGGSAEDWGLAVAVRSSGDVSVSGATASANFPVTPGVVQTGFAGTAPNIFSQADGFVLKFCFEADKTAAPDGTATGATTTNAEYKLAAALDPTVLDVAFPGEDLVPNNTATGRETEIWGRLYRPSTLPAGSSPLIVMLHGNHDTCGRNNTSPRIDDNSQYQLTGTCPQGYSPVLNHMGYDYLATRLASWGYIVVSINANRGITGRTSGPASATNFDPNLIYSRGRLVLKHLQRLSEWNVNGGAPRAIGDLRGKMDFANVGLMGHSRGGEGVRAAYDLYRQAGSPWPQRILNPVTFKGIFEIAPTDGAAYDVDASGNPVQRIFNVDNVAWNVLLPMCDGDLVNLPGIKPLDRVLSFTTETRVSSKSSYTVWGANHNFFNTEWQRSDSLGCLDHAALFAYPTVGSAGSSQQRQIGLASLVAFFRAKVGVSANSGLNQNFDPQFAVPAVVTSVTRVERGYSRSPDASVTRVFEDFNQQTGTNSYGFLNDATGAVTVTHGRVPNHDLNLWAGIITWTHSGTQDYFQSNWSDVGTGTNVQQFQTLDFRVSRRFSASLNSANGTTFSVQLVMADGTLSGTVSLCKYAELTGPIGVLGSVNGTTPDYGGRHPILQTVRIPLQDFSNADLTRLRGVRFVFDGSPTGDIFVANIRLT